MIDWTRICGFEYQEGSPAGSPISCVCGTFAVGRCAQCAEPVCGTHSGLHSGRRRLCSGCWRKADEFAAAQSAAAVREAEVRHQEQLRVSRLGVKASLDGAERTERFVRAAAGLTTGAGYMQGPGLIDWTEMENILGERPEFSVQQIARWMVGRAGGPPSDRINVQRSTLFGSTKTTWLPAWRFNKASTSTWEFMDAAPEHSDLAFTSDGRIYLTGPMSQWVLIDPIPGWVIGNIGISPHGFRQIAAELGLTPVPAPPKK